MEYDLRNDDIEIDLSRLIITIIKKWRMIVLFGIVSALLLGAITFFTSTSSEPEAIPYYESTTSMEIILAEENSEQLLAVLELARSRTVLQRAIKNTNSNLQIDELMESVSVSVETQNGSSILEISVLNEKANLAKKIADEIRETAKKFINNSMNIESFKVVEQANLPNEPIIEELIERDDNNIQRNILKRLILGGLLGILTSIFIIFIQFVLNDKIQTPEDAERYLGKRVLASIPMMERETGNRNGDTIHGRG